jgi:hypothetical protein
VAAAMILGLDYINEIPDTLRPDRS